MVARRWLRKWLGIECLADRVESLEQSRVDAAEARLRETGNGGQNRIEPGPQPSLTDRILAARKDRTEGRAKRREW